ncbi:hypothetical protein PENFLA_c002G06392 [Penicillium flavigenum]|uniref:Uncharacterized protein n=1 Tax=Penicillium flavigenum TaxID=254877 RepID=A0A1V6TXL8_9EURO|nr:hypothetical protein PENFLA_c002G06392 [Penicillium flavigenum]
MAGAAQVPKTQSADNNSWHEEDDVIVTDQADPPNPHSPQLDQQVYPLANEKQSRWPEVEDAVEASEKLAGE